MQQEDIRPKEIFDRFLELSRDDIARHFFSGHDESWRSVNCPLCGSIGTGFIAKDKFNYDRCCSCDTVYINPVPDQSSFESFYTTSKAAKYWNDVFYPITREARIEHIWKRRVSQVLALFEKSRFDTRPSVVDIGGGVGDFAELLIEEGIDVIVVEPNPWMADTLKRKGINVINKFCQDVRIGDLGGGPFLFTSFELFEHLINPSEFVQSIANLMIKGDLFLMTTLSGCGLDIDVLRERSKSLCPPHHVCFANLNALRGLFETKGLSVLSARTPGRLDMSILRDQCEDIHDPFLKMLVTNSDDDLLDRIQNLIANNNMSSHIEILAKK